MKPSTYRWLVIFLLVVILAGCALLAYRHFRQEGSAQERETTVPDTRETEPELQNPAPDFAVYDADGNEYRLSDFRGKPVVLNFWASWCGPCKSEMPDFDEKYQQYGDQVQFLMVNLTDGYNETMETASALIQQQGYSFPVFFDTTMEAAAAYEVYSIPMTCFVDERGELLDTHVGMMSGEVLEQGIGTLLSE